MLSDFYKHMPMPHSNSMMGLDDSIDGHIEPVLPIMVSLSILLYIIQVTNIHYVIISLTSDLFISFMFYVKKHLKTEHHSGV